MKFEGKFDLKISPDHKNDTVIVETMNRVEIKTKYYEKKVHGVVVQKRPKKLIIIAEKDYPIL